MEFPPCEIMPLHSASCSILARLQKCTQPRILPRLKRVLLSGDAALSPSFSRAALLVFGGRALGSPSSHSTFFALCRRSPLLLEPCFRHAVPHEGLVQRRFFISHSLAFRPATDEADSRRALTSARSFARNDGDDN